MWLIVIYLISQAILWWIFGDFGILAKSSDIFSLISTVDVINDTASLNYVTREFTEYVYKILCYAFVDDLNKIKRNSLEKLTV